MRELQNAWHDDIELAIRESYKDKAKLKGSIEGNIGEALIQKYYNQPIHYCDKEDHCDEGYDMILNGAKVDIKCSCQRYEYFGNYNSNWVVNCYKGLKADVYLFVNIDPNNKKIALMGYLPKEIVPIVGTFYRSGEYVPHYPYPCNGDCYIVNIRDLQSIS